MERRIRTTIVALLATLLTVASATLIGAPSAAAASRPTYTVSPSSKPSAAVQKYRNYNSKTRQWYTLKEKLEKLEKKGGGTLVLNRGTYTLGATLYVPSNVTIRMRAGVKVVKGTSNGGASIKVTKSLFHLIRPSRYHRTNAVSGYSGERNITFIGEGTGSSRATIDMNGVSASYAIVMAHNRNVTIQNLTFRRVKSGHFLEVNAVSGLTVKSSSFSDATGTATKEAINIDTPDKRTGGLNVVWSKSDCTPSEKVTITGSSFRSVGRAIGTHKYSGSRCSTSKKAAPALHRTIRITNNTIDGTRTDAIQVMAWKDVQITGNTIRNVRASKRRAVLASGVGTLTFSKNRLCNVPRPLQVMGWRNTGPGKEYAPLPAFLPGSGLTTSQKRAFTSNTSGGKVEERVISVIGANGKRSASWSVPSGRC